MQRKKKNRKKPPLTRALSSNDEEIVAALTEKFQAEDPSRLIAQIPTPLIAKTIIERLPLISESTVEILQLFQSKFKEKSVQKAVKRAFFRLESKGISVDHKEINQIESEPLFKPVAKEAPGIFIGPVGDSTGLRAVLITLNRTVKGQDLAAGIISDEMGIQEFLFGNFTRKKVREIKAEFEENAGPFVETTLAHAGAILETAYNCHNKDDPNNPLPSDFVNFRPILQNMVPKPGKEDLEGHLPSLSESEKNVTQSGLAELFEKGTMKNWIIGFDVLTPYLEDIHKVDESPLVLSEAQKHERIAEIKAKAMNEIFTANKRALLRDRLSEMSYFFSKLGDDRTSRLALAASGCIYEDGPIISQNPVLEYIMESSFAFYSEGINQGAREDEDKDR
jgi:hypothetical protein